MSSQNPKHIDFQKVKDILVSIRILITEETDVTWSRYNTVNEFLKELDTDIEKIHSCDVETLHRVNGEFAPTSTYNEISFSSGWGQEYINLSAKFDRIYEKITKNEL